MQEALIAADAQWPTDGVPANPLGWLVRVASRRQVDQHRTDQARRRREEAVAAAGPPDARSEPVSGADDSLLLVFMCCHPALPTTSAIPLTLRAVGGLTTAEIAAAFLVPEATMAKRISRAKTRVRDADATFDRGRSGASQRLGSVLHVLYLMFNEGYATSSGPDLARPDLSGEAIGLTRVVHERLPVRAGGRRTPRPHAVHRRPPTGSDRTGWRAGAAGGAGPLGVGPTPHGRGVRPPGRGHRSGRCRHLSARGVHRRPARRGADLRQHRLGPHRGALPPASSGAPPTPWSASTGPSRWAWPAIPTSA